MRYEIQTLFANGEWQSPDGETYGSKAEAEAELQDLAHKYGCYFVFGECFSDFNAEDWRVRECEYEEYEGEEC